MRENRFDGLLIFFFFVLFNRFNGLLIIFFFVFLDEEGRGVGLITIPESSQSSQKCLSHPRP
jgi:hypothetical protein